jgi:enamine deaminase RidA (YjgF/YER057c/UK114 family)
MNIEARLRELGLELPSLIQLPPEVRAPFSWVRLYGDRAYVSGQAPLNPDGTLAAPFGRVGAELSQEQGYQAARLATLSVLATLKQALGARSAIGMAQLPNDSPVIIAAEVAVRGA